MGDLTTSIERPAVQLSTFTVPSLRLPRFEQGQVVVERPANAVRQAPSTPPAPIAASTPAPAPAPPAPFTPYAAPSPASTASIERLAHLRRDAMLGLVLGIASAVIAASFVLAMWASMHGDPPGMH